jgi:hypothetical protein
MLWVKAVAERMADYVVGHHPTMPSAGKAAQAVASTRRLEHSLHASIMTIVPCLCKAIAAASSAEVSKQLNALSARPKMCRLTGASPIAGAWPIIRGECDEGVPFAADERS